MPAPVPVAYDSGDPSRSYKALCESGGLQALLAGVPCPRAGCRPAGNVPSLVLTDSTIDRVVKLLKHDPHEALFVVAVVIEIALARCRVCRGRFRVLPCDVAPHKRYGLGVIEHLVGEYGKGARGLRPVAWELYGEAPAHTTLHAWTEGLGAYAEGREAGEVVGAVSASRAMAEAEMRYPDLAAVRRAPVKVDPRRYRSEGRRERLAACVRFVRLAAALASGTRGCSLRVASSLVEWSRLMLRWCRSSPIGFRSGRRCTPFEHGDRRPERSSAATAKPEEVACRIPTRSRSGATSRSPP